MGTQKRLLCVFVGIITVSNSYANSNYDERFTLFDLMTFSETRDLMELSNMLISKDCKLVSNQSKDGVVTMIWERYEEVLTVLFDEGFPSICYHFTDNERYSSLQGDLNTILNDDWEENDFKKLSPPQIENGKLIQAYVNNRFYLSFTISTSPEQFDTWYDVCCRCLISEEEYLEKGEAEEMVRMYNSRFNARELVEMVKTLDKNIIRNYLIGKDWEPDEDFDDWFVYADTFSTSYPIEDMDSSMLFFKPAIKIFAGFWSDMNDVGVYDEGMSERFNCFIPNRKDGCLANIIVLSLFRTAQDSLIKDLLKNGFTKVFHKEEILAPLSGQIGATFCTKTRDMYQFEDICVVIITYEDDNDYNHSPKKWYTIYAYDSKDFEKSNNRQ